MATDDEVRRLILEVIGEDKVKSLREQIDQEKESLLRLTAALSHLTPEEMARDKGVQLSTIHLAEMNQELRNLEGTHRNVGRAALELSRAMEDLQYGVGGVVNNIPGLVMALGGGAGLTAVISLVAVGVNQLVKYAFPEWEGGVKKVKEAHHELTEEMKEQIKALKALDEAKPKAEGVEAVIGAHREEIRTAVGVQMRGDVEADIARLTAREDVLARGAPSSENITELFRTRQLLARARGRLPGIQREADVAIGRAALGGLPELARIQGLFGPETEIGARLVEAGPERAEQREREERDVERQRRNARLQEQLDRKKQQEEEKAERARVDMNTAQLKAIEDSRKVEEQAAKDKAREAKAEAQAAKRAASAKERQARKAEREFIEDVQLRADQAIAAGAPAGLVGQQAAMMFERMARTNGRTTDLAQAQGRLMLHLQHVQERQQRQLEAAERDLQRGWDNAFRRGK